MMWEKWEGWSRINIKKHNLVKTNYTVLFGFLTTNRFYHGKNTHIVIHIMVVFSGSYRSGFCGGVAMAALVALLLRSYCR